jgi:hypothetical protein
MAISNINYSTIEYVLENYLNIPSHLLEKLLSELEKPVRE